MIQRTGMSLTMTIRVAWNIGNCHVSDPEYKACIGYRGLAGL